jgi:hypothetical protein
VPPNCPNVSSYVIGPDGKPLLPSDARTLILARRGLSNFVRENVRVYEEFLSGYRATWNLGYSMQVATAEDYCSNMMPDQQVSSLSNRLKNRDDVRDAITHAVDPDNTKTGPDLLILIEQYRSYLSICFYYIHNGMMTI